MFGKFTSQFITNLFVYAFVSLFFGIPILIYYLLIGDYAWLGIAVVLFFMFLVCYGTFKDIYEKEAEQSELEISNLRRESNLKLTELVSELNKSEEKEKMSKQLLTERSSGFPTLFKYLENYESYIDGKLSDHLRYKNHPAISSSEVVKEEAKRRREAEFLQRKTQSIIEYYENIAPFLLDFKEQEIDETEDSLREYTKEESEDPVTNYLTKEEYRKLSSVKRNQMALDRFWKRHKSKWLLGRIYERYVGYLYERDGYGVDYTGIFKGFEDLGRDLICTKGSEIIIIQCKNWSQFKTIFEKHIFQFFGTVFQYRDENPKKKVKAIFYTTTEVSDLARRFAKELSIELKEKQKLPNDYPCIKCNISQVDGSRIYHLPFDQQYDNTKIETKKGEFYCATVAEAESKGFRRAFRWKGTKAD